MLNSPGAERQIIVNPVAAGGQSGRRWPQIERKLRSLGLAFQCRFTLGAGDARRMAAEAAAQGFPMVVATGGDGTVNEVVNGLMEVPAEVRPVLGIISTGRGRDLLRTLQGDISIEEACSRLAGSQVRDIDLGLVECWQGQVPVKRYFVNVAGIGFEAEVAGRAKAGARGTIPYLLSVFSTLLGYRNRRVELTLNGQSVSAVMNSLTVANGQYYGGGMHIAPQADLADGQLNVIMVGNIGKLELIANLPRVYRGTHLAHAKVSCYRVASLSASSPELTYVHTDGELVGHLPATFRVLPQTLRVWA